MKGKITPDLLADCLADIRAGRATVEECAAAHPSAGEELRALLTVALAIPTLPAVTPDLSFRVRGRASLIAAINAEKNTVTGSSSQRYGSLRIGGWVLPMQPLLRRMEMPALVIAIVIAFTAATGGGAAFASQGALPGEALYPVKTAVEQIQTALAFGDEAKAETHIALAEKRASEIEKALQRQNTAASDTAAEAFVKEVAEADQRLTTAAGSGKDVSKLLARLKDNLARHEKVLAGIGGRAPEQARDALARAAAATEKGLKNASTRVQGEARESSGDSANAASGAGKGTARPAETAEGKLPSATLDVTSTASVAVSIALTQAISDVQKLATDRNVSGQNYEGLLAKLHAAREAIDRGQTEVAVRVLDAFLNEMNAFRSAGHISAENYNTLYSNYSSLVKSLGGSPKFRAGAESTQPGGTSQPTATPSAGRLEPTNPPRGRK
ncbi:MAG: hypothetical protein HYX94_08855 [Chloroflexi bacterium]|nr:hypothetical protein [Chloroflexota bacterium]